jgi:hypothetical protein
VFPGTDDEGKGAADVGGSGTWQMGVLAMVECRSVGNGVG